MVNIFKICYNVFIEIKKKYMNPYLLKIKRMISPVKIWSFGGKNPDKIIYLITDVSLQYSGTFSLYLGILDKLSFAETMNWVPVIDTSSELFRKMKTKEMNAFVRNLFRFQNEIPFEEVFQSKNVIISTMTNQNKLLQLYHKNEEQYKVRSVPIFDLQDNEVEWWRELAYKRMLYRDDIQKQLNESYFQVVQGKKNILSLAVREGKMFLDKKTRERTGEHLQPSIEKIIAVTKKYYKEWKCEYIYLSCEARETIGIFKKIFGDDRILVLDRYRFTLEELKAINKSGRIFFHVTAKVKNYDIDYIKDMYILSKGNSIICPINCGTEAAYIMGSGFRHHYIIRED